MCLYLPSVLFAEEVILAEERTTDEEKAHIMEGECECSMAVVFVKTSTHS